MRPTRPRAAFSSRTCASVPPNRGARPSTSGVSLLAHARRVATRQRADTTCGWSWRASPPRVACETNFLRVRAPLSRRGLLGGAGRAHAARPAVVRASAFLDARVGGGRAAPRERFKESSSRRRFRTHLALDRPFLACFYVFHLFRHEPTRLPCARHSVALASRSANTTSLSTRRIYSMRWITWLVCR